MTLSYHCKIAIFYNILDCGNNYYPLSQDIFFFLSGFSFTDNGDSQDSMGPSFFTSTTSVYLQTFRYFLELWMWDDYHIFLIASLANIKLLLNEIYCLGELPFDWLIMACWFMFDYLMMLFFDIFTAIWCRKVVDLNMHQLQLDVTSKPNSQAQ